MNAPQVATLKLEWARVGVVVVVSLSIGGQTQQGQSGNTACQRDRWKLTVMAAKGLEWNESRVGREFRGLGG